MTMHRDTGPVERTDSGGSGPAGGSADSASDSSTTASAAIAFLATVSHEIRTPVNAILGYHELLELGLGGPLTDKQRHYIERASASGRHLLAIVDEVLDFARLDADRIEIGREAFPMGGVIADALMLVAPQARQQKVHITNASGRGAQPIAALGDPSRVRQILINLLSNAVKFTEPRDGSAGRLTVSTGSVDQPPPDARVSAAGPHVFVRIEDTGPGIPPERLEAIFDPFVQGDAALTLRYGGTGLGLAISRRFARLMGGDLTASSDVGLGSTFFLWLPAAPDEIVSQSGRETPRDAAPPVLDVLTSLLEPSAPVPRSGTLPQVARAIIDHLESILERYLQRLRTDPLTPSAHDAPTSRIEDHLASFLADLAATLESLEIADGEMAESLLDSSSIQRTIASKHGEQRARLGWQEDEIRREYHIIEEELTALIRRVVTSAEGTNRAEEVDAALALLRQFLDTAQRRSLTSYRAARKGTDLEG